MLKRCSVVAVVALLLSAPLTASSAAAQELGLDQENPQELFEGATRMMMKALELLIKTMPQYDPPVVLENGDILIRRQRPAGDAPRSGDAPDQDRT